MTPRPQQQSPFATDPGPVPDEGLRIFLPSALGDLQTAGTYAGNAVIRLMSAQARDEKFTGFEQRAAAAAFKELAQTLEMLKTHLSAAYERGMQP